MNKLESIASVDLFFKDFLLRLLTGARAIKSRKPLNQNLKDSIFTQHFSAPKLQLN